MSDYKVDIDLDAVEAASARGHALSFPQTRVSNAIDGFVTGVAAVFNWIWLILIVLIVVNVVLRYVRERTTSRWRSCSGISTPSGSCSAWATAVDLDAHVRVDVVAEHWSARRRAWIEFFGILVFVIPFVWLIVANAIPFVRDPHDASTRSPRPPAACPTAG